MGYLLYWWLDKPDEGISDISWTTFLNTMSIVLLLAVLVTVILTLICYRLMASRRKIYSLEDVFARFTPMYSLFCSPAAGIMVALAVSSQYAATLDTTQGEFGVLLRLALVSVIAAAAIAYLLIIAVPQLTPDKFRYRPAPYLHRRRGVAVDRSTE